VRDIKISKCRFSVASIGGRSSHRGSQPKTLIET
jgi:hypothetical protein